MAVQFEKKQGVAGAEEGEEEKGDVAGTAWAWKQPSSHYVYDGTRPGSADLGPGKKIESMTFYDSDVTPLEDDIAKKSFRTQRTELPAVKPSQIKPKVSKIIEEGGEELEKGEEELGQRGEKLEDGEVGTVASAEDSDTAAVTAAEENGEIVKINSQSKLRG